jgi:hypothetical protein
MGPVDAALDTSVFPTGIAGKRMIHARFLALTLTSAGATKTANEGSLSGLGS